MIGSLVYSDGQSVQPPRCCTKCRKSQPSLYQWVQWQGLHAHGWRQWCVDGCHGSGAGLPLHPISTTLISRLLVFNRVTFDLDFARLRVMTIALLGLKVKVRVRLGSQFETRSVGPRSSIEDSVLFSSFHSFSTSDSVRIHVCYALFRQQIESSITSHHYSTDDRWLGAYLSTLRLNWSQWKFNQNVRFGNTVVSSSPPRSSPSISHT